MKIEYNKKIFEIDDIKTCSEFGKIKGLMFTPREKARILLFNFSGKHAIHSFFVFFPFLSIWLDDENKVMEKRMIKPFTPFALPEKSFSKLIEIPANKKYDGILKLLDES